MDGHTVDGSDPAWKSSRKRLWFGHPAPDRMKSKVLQVQQKSTNVFAVSRPASANGLAAEHGRVAEVLAEAQWYPEGL